VKSSLLCSEVLIIFIIHKNPVRYYNGSTARLENSKIRAAFQMYICGYQNCINTKQQSIFENSEVLFFAFLNISKMTKLTFALALAFLVISMGDCAIDDPSALKTFQVSFSYCGSGSICHSIST